MNKPNNKTISDIITRLGISALPQNDREHIATELYNSAINQILVYIFDKLPNGHIAKLTKLLEHNHYDEVYDSIKKYIPEVDGMFETILDNIIMKYKELLAINKKIYEYNK